MDSFKNRRSSLVRTSSLDPRFIRNNLSLVNTPVKLLFEKDSSEMTRNWTEEEVKDQRRLVKFEFVRLSSSDYLVKFFPIPKSEFTNDAAVISCIFWKEKDLHIVTSVDIILLLEYLIQESFSIEEKNRIRRNLQSLKPLTISRSNKSYSRFFQLLMSMEDPRPRNIEKDLKVFKWPDLFSALNKVISKYSSSTRLSDSELAQMQDTIAPSIKSNASPQIIEEVSSDKLTDKKKPSSTNGHSLTNLPYGDSPVSDRSIPGITTTTTTTRTTTSHDPTTNTTTTTTTVTPIPEKPTGNEEHESFLPYERLKVMKKKLNSHGHNGNSGVSSSGTANFQPAIAPQEKKAKSYHSGSAPVPVYPVSTETSRPLSSMSSSSSSQIGTDTQISKNQSGSSLNNYRLPIQHPQVQYFKQEPKLPQPALNTKDNSGRKEKVEVDSESSSTEDSGESSSTYAVTSSDEQVDDKKSQSRSTEDDVSLEMRYEGKVAENVNRNYSFSGSSGNESKQFSGGSSGGNSSGSKIDTGSDGRGVSGSAESTSVFSKPMKSQYTGSSEVTDDNQRPGESFSNISKFAQDQSDRIFGGPQTYGDKQFYRYPDASQVHYMHNSQLSDPATHRRSSVPASSQPQRPSHLSGSGSSQNVKKFPFVTKSDSRPAKSDIQLPSLEEYFQSSKGQSDTKLAPIRKPSKGE